MDVKLALKRDLIQHANIRRRAGFSFSADDVVKWLKISKGEANLLIRELLSSGIIVLFGERYMQTKKGIALAEEYFGYVKEEW